MSDPTRDDLAKRLHDKGAWCGVCEYTWDCDMCQNVCRSYVDVVLAEFEAIVDADPRWVRTEQKDIAWEHVDQRKAELERSRFAYDSMQRSHKIEVDHLRAQLAERDRHWVQVTQDCDVLGCVDGLIDEGDEGHMRCDVCGGSGKVPADGVSHVQPDASAAWLMRLADAGRVWILEGSDDE